MVMNNSPMKIDSNKNYKYYVKIRKERNEMIYKSKLIK